MEYFTNIDILFSGRVTFYLEKHTPNISDKGVIMDYKNINFADIEISAVTEAQYPTLDLPEVALAGRSNVGKSSLINSLVNRKKLARTSGNPGKTRTLNFFNIEQEIMFVDVPGYGYAKVSKKEQGKWGAMMEEYFSLREELKLGILIVDLRHKPTVQDRQMYDFLKYYDLPVLVIATKSDKIKNSQRKKLMNQVIDTLEMFEEDMLVSYSSKTREGKDEVWKYILDYTRND